MDDPARADILVTGGTGFLGATLVRRLAHDPALRVAATRHASPPLAGADVAWEAVDLADTGAGARLVARLRPRLVVHTAVPARAEDLAPVIVLGSAGLARACRAHGAEFVHVSSDMVFDGVHGPFAEDAPLSPITPYGAAKAEAERRVRAEHPGAWIVRSSLLYRVDPPDRALSAWLHGLADGTAYPLFEDEIRCPAPAEDVADALGRLARDVLAGTGPAAGAAQRTLHFVGPSAIDRWTFGTAILRALGIDPGRAARARLADSGLVRPRSLVLTRAATPAAWVEAIRSPAAYLSTPRTRPGGPPGDRS